MFSGVGSPLYVDCRSLCEDEYSAEQQSAIFEMAEYLQGSDDNGSCDRSSLTPQRHPETERATAIGAYPN